MKLRVTLIPTINLLLSTKVNHILFITMEESKLMEEVIVEVCV